MILSGYGHFMFSCPFQLIFISSCVFFFPPFLPSFLPSFPVFILAFLLSFLPAGLLAPTAPPTHRPTHFPAGPLHNCGQALGNPRNLCEHPESRPRCARVCVCVCACVSGAAGAGAIRGRVAGDVIAVKDERRGK